MTDQETIIVIGNLPVNGDECFDITKYQEAKARAIKAIEENVKLKEAIKKIKEEIKEHRYASFIGIHMPAIMALIDKHTEGLV